MRLLVLMNITHQSVLVRSGNYRFTLYFVISKPRTYIYIYEIGHLEEYWDIIHQRVSIAPNGSEIISKAKFASQTICDNGIALNIEHSSSSLRHYDVEWADKKREYP